MKEQVSITINKELLKEIEESLKDGLFRNKSHLFEYAVRRLLKEK